MFAPYLPPQLCGETLWWLDISSFNVMEDKQKLHWVTSTGGEEVISETPAVVFGLTFNTSKS